jgi:ribosome assembly protein YihI (activator of Der GTPase)
METDTENNNMTFRDLYMSEMTDSFANELDLLRQDEGLDGHKMKLLIDCLESGTHLYNKEEQEFILAAFNRA